MDKILYLFYKPTEGLPFYCGIGRWDRPAEHFRPRNLKLHYLLYNTLRRMLLVNLIPRIKIVETNLTWLDACELEIQFIQFYGRLDKGTGCLTNQTDGGDGGWLHVERSHERSLETRNRISHSKIKRNREPGQREKLSKAHSVEMTPIECFIEDKIIQKFESQHQVKLFGFSQAGVQNVLAGRAKTHGGYHWRYSKREA